MGIQKEIRKEKRAKKPLLQHLDKMIAKCVCKCIFLFFCCSLLFFSRRKAVVAGGCLVRKKKIYALVHSLYCVSKAQVVLFTHDNEMPHNFKVVDRKNPSAIYIRKASTSAPHKKGHHQALQTHTLEKETCGRLDTRMLEKWSHICLFF